jgi:hypothetical protein
MYILQKLDEIFCIHQLGPFDLWCDLVLGFLLLIFCLNDLSFGDGGIKFSHYHCVGWSLYMFLDPSEYD